MLLDDVRSAARSVSRAKTLTAILLITLGIGTGANTAVFSVVDALLFRAPSGIAEPERLVSIFTSQYDASPYGPSSLRDVRSVAAGASAFVAVAAFDDHLRTNVRLDNFVQFSRVAAVSEQFFSALALAPHTGRLPSPREIAEDAAVAVVSFDLWHSLRRSDVSGTWLSLKGREYLVVGVAPAGFRGLHALRPTDVWVPLAPASSSRGDRRLRVVARLHEGRTIESANGQLAVVARQLADTFPESNRGTRVDADVPRRLTAIAYSPLDPGSRAQTSVIAAVVAGAVVLLLVSACLNAGTLLLSRGFARRRELAVKMALGAARRRLMRQLLIESLIVAVGGAALGLLFASWTMSVIPSLFSPDHAALLDTTVRPAVMLVAVLAACVAGALFGVAPAFHATSAPAGLALRADSAGISVAHGGTVLRSILVGVQLMVSTVLLLATALLIGSLRGALNRDATFPARNIAIASLEHPGRFQDQVRGVRFHEEALQRLASMPPVTKVGWTSVPPLVSSAGRAFQIQAGVGGLTDAVELELMVVSGDYFAVSGVELVEGRLFDASDHALSDPVAVVDEHLARRYFGARATGHFLVDADGVRSRIVGVVKPRRYRALQDVSRTTVYYPLKQHYQAQGHWLIQTRGEVAPHLLEIDRLLRRVDDRVEIQRVIPLDQHLDAALAVERLTTTLVGLCGTLALAMAVLGAYGVMSDAVRRRTREIGLRVALGAAPRQVAHVVLKDLVLVLAAGLASGVGVALIARRMVLMYVAGVPAFDLATLLSAPGILAAIVCLAAVFPLRRALAVSAATALRAE